MLYDVNIDDIPQPSHGPLYRSTFHGNPVIRINTKPHVTTSLPRLSWLADFAWTMTTAPAAGPWPPWSGSQNKLRFRGPATRAEVPWALAWPNSGIDPGTLTDFLAQAAGAQLTISHSVIGTVDGTSTIHVACSRAYDIAGPKPNRYFRFLGTFTIQTGTPAGSHTFTMPGPRRPGQHVWATAISLSETWGLYRAYTQDVTIT